MTFSIKNSFQKLPFDILKLNLSLTLSSGQSFRWKEHRKNEYIGVVKDQIWIIKQDNDFIYYKCQKKAADAIEEVNLENKFETLIQDYFRLDIDLDLLYDRWNSADDIFKKKASSIRGVRILRQDPVENIFSFICSTNNNISRISMLVEKLCSSFGDLIDEIDGIKYFSFPTIDALCGENVENELKSLGYGYRSKYIATTAQRLKEKYSRKFLEDLREEPYDICKKFLLSLPGIGPKVADCVCLMSLDKLNVVPVDTHVRQVAERDYGFKIASKSLTDSAYSQISNFFQELWGEYAGWAQSIIFTSELSRKRPFDSKD